MTPPSFEQVMGWSIAILSGGGFVKALDIWAKRDRDNRAEPSALTRAFTAERKALSAGSRELVDAFRSEFKFLRGRVADLQEEADKSKALAAAALIEAAESRQESADFKAAHARCEAKVAELTRRIDELMAGPPADYRAQDLRRPPRRET